MTDSKSNAEKCLQSPTSIEQNSTTCANSNSNNLDVPMLDEKDPQSANSVVNKTLEMQQASSNPKKKVKKPKKKKSETATATGSNNTTSSNNNNNNNNNNNSGEGASAQLPPLYQSSLPIYCKKCLGRNVGKKGERSDVYVITCSKCGAHEVLMKPDGNGVVKINDPGLSEALPQGDLLDAAWKSAGDKAMSALELKEEDYPKDDEQMSSRISVFSQRLQHCSKKCADLYPLIITLRSLQLKKTSATPQQRKNLETELKTRISSLEEEIHVIESFEAKYFKKSPSAHLGSGVNSSSAAAAPRKKKCSTPSSSAGATSAEARETSSQVKETSSQANSSLFESLTPAATSPPGVVSPVSEEHNVVSRQATGGATAIAPDSVATASSKPKSSIWYIERVEKLNSRLEIMHSRLTKYCMIQSIMIQNKAEEAIAKAKKNETEVIHSLHDFVQGIVDQCKSTTVDCVQKVVTKRKDIKRKERLIAEARTLTEQCIANGDEVGLRQVEEMLRQINLQN